MKLISACSIGINCRYNEENKLDDKVTKLLNDEELIPVCPEQLGGLPTPERAEWISGQVVSQIARAAEHLKAKQCFVT